MDNIPSTHHELPARSCQHGSSDYEPTPDALIVGAYYRYVDQGFVPGHELSDWLDAERLLEDHSRLERRVR